METMWCVFFERCGNDLIDNVENLLRGIPDATVARRSRTSLIIEDDDMTVELSFTTGGAVVDKLKAEAANDAPLSIQGKLARCKCIIGLLGKYDDENADINLILLSMERIEKLVDGIAYNAYSGQFL